MIFASLSVCSTASGLVPLLYSLFNLERVVCETDDGPRERPKLLRRENGVQSSHNGNESIQVRTHHCIARRVGITWEMALHLYALREKSQRLTIV
ncbi:hypothetical protein BJ170DRAFT_200584 [Xylariales sp. AK1849]|nr:hypothetical protein BJ170DRAFT_200584 [Xylariales sp. AK1849]